MRIILASGSPRRKEILSSIVNAFEIITSDTDESYEKQAPEQVVEELSRRKADAVLLQLDSPDAVIIGADTVVANEGRILGKPQNREDAVMMLKGLQGKKHQVYTGVTLIEKHGSRVIRTTFHECTNVSVLPMTEQAIREYVASGECDDKAGSYAIQGIFSKYIEGYEGDYYNVVGLPKEPLRKKLKEMITKGCNIKMCEEA
ncbi:MAG TPA: Maf family protein [Lachnospiraceae bacterium]|nr:Maf family protein [Lachnospiraceae bacterium]